MDVMNEIDKLLASMETEKVESAENVQPGAILDDHQPSEYDPDFVDAILNEAFGDVGTQENNENVSSTAATLLTEDEQVAQLKLQDTTPFYHSSSAASDFIVNEVDSPAVPLEANGTPVVTVTYQLDDQQMVILPTKFSPNQNIPVLVTDTLPFQLINTNSEITSAIAADNNCLEEAPATTTTTYTPNPSGSRKRKLYEEDEFLDPEMEKKRQNAINARNHRIRTKETIQDLQQRLNTKEQECVALIGKVEEMKRKLEEQQSAHKLESTTLKNQNEELKHKLQILTFLTS